MSLTVEAAEPINVLISVISDTDFTADTRCSAAKSLADLGRRAESAIPALKKVVQTDTNHDVRQEAAKALGKLGPKAVPALVELSKLQSKTGDIETGVSAGLSEMGPSAGAAAPHIVEVIKHQLKSLPPQTLGSETDENNALSISVLCDTLASINGDSSIIVPVLVEVVSVADVANSYDVLDGKDKALYRRWCGVAAIAVLSKYREKASPAVNVLTHVLKHPVTYYNNNMITEAARALGVIGAGAESALPALREIVTRPEHNGTDLGRAAEEALAQIKTAVAKIAK